MQKVPAQAGAARTGAAVVLTTTGRVLAMASYPSYNPDVWTHGLSHAEFRQLFGAASYQPALNRVTQGQYSPGSTWKVTSVAAAVANGYPLDGQYNCPGTVTIGGSTYANDGNPSLGPMSFYTALVQSCDTVFYNLAYGMWQRDNLRANVVTTADAPVQKMQKMELAWGFGKPAGVDLPEQSAGAVPTRKWLYYFWKDNAHRGQNWCKYGRAGGSYVQELEYNDCHSANVWTAGQAVISSIGQGYVEVTPLQLADGYAALANGGTLYSPRVGQALIRPDGTVDRRITPPVAGHLPVAPHVLAYIRSALAGVVTSGTAAGAFGGFPQSGHPKFGVVVMVPNAGYGANVAAPAVRQIWDALYGLEGRKAALPGGRLPALPSGPRVSGSHR